MGEQKRNPWKDVVFIAFIQDYETAELLESLLTSGSNVCEKGLCG